MPVRCADTGCTAGWFASGPQRPRAPRLALLDGRTSPDSGKVGVGTTSGSGDEILKTPSCFASADFLRPTPDFEALRNVDPRESAKTG